MVESYAVATDRKVSFGNGDRCPMSLADGGITLVTSVRWQDVSTPVRPGPLSVKMARGGREEYRVGGRHLPVSDRNYLILNRGEEYAASVPGGKSMETFCIFFRNDLAEAGLRDLVVPDDQLLDDPEQVDRDPVQFYSGLRRHDAILWPRLTRLRQRLEQKKITPIWLEEETHRLLYDMIRLHRADLRVISTLPAKRTSTRVEQFRRVHRGRDFMEGHLAEEITIEMAAQAACLSTYHFLRLFRQVFGVTPGRYLSDRRIEEAEQLLATTDLPVAQVCDRIGFASPGSFSDLFRRRTGTTPGGYRRASQKKQL